MHKLGLVFAGGGGKGAYEVGVYKALQEYGVDKNIKAVSGTSVGGLNGALFAKGDLELALRVWEEMNPKKILQINPEKILSILSKFHLGIGTLTLIGEKLGFLKSEGVFTQNGLKSIVESSLKDGELKSKIPFYICATDVSDKLSWKPLYKKLNDLDYKTQIEYLLATSAIPVAFPTTIVEERELLDGFLTDNTPVKPLIENEGCTNIIVVLLGRSESITKLKKEYPDVSFWEIVPSADTKESLGSLDFKQERAQKLISMGYEDTIKILKDLHEFMQTEKEYLEKGVVLQKQDENFAKIFDAGTKQIAYNLDTTQKQLINTKIDTLLDSMQENSQEFSKLAFEAVTTLSANRGKVNYQQEQGAFSRLLGGLSGANHKLQADVNSNFTTAIYANTQLIKKLAQRNNLTLDVCISLGNKINFLAQNEMRLQQQNEQHSLMLNELKNSILTLAQLTKDAIAHNSSRIDKLEYGQNLLNWSHHLKSSIQGLNDYDAIMSAVGSYYAITNSTDEDKESSFLYSALINSGFDKVEINPAKFIKYAQEQNQLTLFDTISSSEVLPLPKTYEPYAPLFASLSYIYEEPTINETTISKKLIQNYDLDVDVEMDGVSFAFELLSGLKLASDIKNSFFDEKNNLKTKLQILQERLEKDKIDSFKKAIYLLNTQIEEFKIIVPLVGKFSSGKSKLLNSYIAKDEKLFEVDTNPTTAVATEIHYAPINSIKEFKNGEKLLYVKHFLNYPKLKNRSDLVLVDMPGFESSNLQHNDAINHYFSRGQHYILALSCESTNDKSILKHIKEILSYGADFSIVITKTDKKLPRDIEKTKNVLKQNIYKLFKIDDFFIGTVSAFKDDIEDFEKIIDSVYESSSVLFKRKFIKEYEQLQKDVIHYYEQLLNTPNDTLAFEKQKKEEEQKLEQEKQTLKTKLKNIEFSLVSDGAIVIQDKVKNILNANKSMLVSSAKNNTLTMSITEMLRSPLNATFKQLIEKSIAKVEKENINIENEMTINISHINIDTELSWWKKIINFFSNSHDEEIEQKIASEVIPKIVNEIYNSSKSDLENTYKEVVTLVDKKISQKQLITKKLQDELQEQMNMQNEEFELQQKKFKESFEKIKGLQWD